MTTPRKKRAPLVADKRYNKASARKPAKAQTAARRPKSKSRRKRKTHPIAGFFGRIFRFFGRLIWALTWRATVIFVSLVALAVGYFWATMPDVTALMDGRARGSVTLLDRDGNVFAWRGDQFGGVITAENMSPNLVNAVVATEDKRFYRHFGLSPRGIASAIRINLSEGRGPLAGHGGSTITQQTAKLLCLGVPFDPGTWKSEAAYEADCRKTTMWRKAKEAVYAMAMELAYSKDEILTVYLNRVFLGAGARGVEAASQRYFGKSATSVSIQEGAMIAGLLVAPTRYAPTSNLKRSQDRASVVLNLLAEQGFLTEEELRNAKENPATLSEAAQDSSGGYFADWVMSEAPTFLAADTTEDVIISTTFDPRIQTAAEEALAEVLDARLDANSEAEAAIIVMSADGAVRAMVGGRNSVTGGFNRATQARRQTGSAFKPFVYATALELGFTPNATVVDEPLTINIPGSGPWTPRNYSGKNYGRVTLTEALSKSLNIPAVIVSEEVGRENVRNVAADFGIESDLADGPALALGASESTLIEMTGAYAGILNGGRSVTPYGLVELSLMGDAEPLIGQVGGFGERVISQTAAGYLTYMMSKVTEDGTGKRAALKDRPTAGKTGTTQASRDAWFVGFSADYVAGVWMGNDDNSPLRGVTGGGLPAEIWRETMRRVHEGLDARPLTMVIPTAPVREIAPPPRDQVGANGVERVILDVLEAILGGGN